MLLRVIPATEFEDTCLLNDHRKLDELQKNGVRFRYIFSTYPFSVTETKKRERNCSLFPKGSGYAYTTREETNPGAVEDIELIPYSFS